MCRKSGSLSFKINEIDYGVAIKSEQLTDGNWYPTFGMQGKNEQIDFINNYKRGSTLDMRRHICTKM